MMEKVMRHHYQLMPSGALQAFSGALQAFSKSGMQPMQCAPELQPVDP